jgi:hypothetical protein
MFLANGNPAYAFPRRNVVQTSYEACYIKKTFEIICIAAMGDFFHTKVLEKFISSSPHKAQSEIFFGLV